MKKNIFNVVMALIAMCLMVASCKPDNEEKTITMVNYGLKLDMPLTIEKPTLSNAKAVFTNVQTKETFSFTEFKASDGQYVAVFSLPAGIYDVVVDGTVAYKVNGKDLSTNVKATQRNVTVDKGASEGANPSLVLPLNTFNSGAGFVISEVFFAGTRTLQNKDYVNDQYIKIANNSDTVMYADGLAIVQSLFQTNMKNDYKPNVMNSAMTVDDVFVIPGSGKEHPVQPGEEIVIAWNARNHKEFNTNSIDLSKANFQMYSSMTLEDVDENGEDIEKEVQNDKVPLLLHWYGSDEGRLTPNRAGVRAYALVRIPMTAELLKKNYEYEIKWVEADDPTNFENTETHLMIPNVWVLDAVNLATTSDHQWNVVSAALDAGFTSWAETLYDAGSYRKAVLRKKEGKNWKDTNNSTQDFDAFAVPSYFK
ncbi:DUF4876 domain-containing protein [Prevotella sp.]